MKRRCDKIFSVVNHNPCVGKCNTNRSLPLPLLVSKLSLMILTTLSRSTKSHSHHYLSFTFSLSFAFVYCSRVHCSSWHASLVSRFRESKLSSTHLKSKFASILRFRFPFKICFLSLSVYFFERVFTAHSSNFASFRSVSFFPFPRFGSFFVNQFSIKKHFPCFIILCVINPSHRRSHPKKEVERKFTRPSASLSSSS